MIESQTYHGDTEKNRGARVIEKIVKPNKSLAEVEAKSVRKKMKDKAFARISPGSGDAENIYRSQKPTTETREARRRSFFCNPERSEGALLPSIIERLQT